MRRALLLPVLILAAACGRGRGAAPTGAAAAEAAVRLFQTRCAPCHGQDGRGDGPGAVSLSPRPRDFHDPAWQAHVTDDHIRQTLLGGGLAVGKSPNMPANPDLRDQPDVVRALVARVRSFAR